MGDRSRDTRNATTGETAQETVDRMAGDGGSKPTTDGGAKGPLVPTKPAPQNTHPSAKGVYGSPIDPPLVK